MRKCDRRHGFQTNCAINFCYGEVLVLALALALGSSLPCQAQDQPTTSEPKLLSVFPLGGRRGTALQAKVRGNWLEGSYGVWFDASGLSGRLLKVEEVKPEPTDRQIDMEPKKKKPLTIYQAVIELEIQPTATLGVHSLRLVGTRGISDAIPFSVGDTPVIMEVSVPHQNVERAQPVPIPVVVNGKLEKPGDLDYYSFHAKRAQNLSFEIVTIEDFNPRLAVYRAGGSWFDPERPTRLLFQEERLTDLQMPGDARRTFEAPQDGEYFLEVSALLGSGSADSSYQVKINSLAQKYQSAVPFEPITRTKEERSFTRELDYRWLASLETQEVQVPPEVTKHTRGAAAGAAAEEPPDSPADQQSRQAPGRSSDRKELSLTFVDQPANGRAAAIQEITVPTLISGVINHPGEVHSFKLKIRSGQKLAFEIETPGVQPPYFNPTLTVVNSQNHEEFSNVERIMSMFNNNGTPFSYLNQVEPKAIYSFEHGGDYVLNIRDITSRYGNAGFRYNILVRRESRTWVKCRLPREIRST